MKNILFIITIFFTYPVFSNVCYDVTTPHQCRQSNSPSTTRDSFNNKNLKTAYDIQLTTDSISSRISCGKGSSSEQNIADIHQVIDQLQLSSHENFVCKMEVTIRSHMQTILDDRQFMKDYIERKKSSTLINKEDKIKMTYLLIKYRLFRNQDDVCGTYVASAGECYFSAARFDAPEEAFKQMQSAAQRYMQKATEPDTCLFNEKEYPLSSAECENEILSRVQAVPVPLVLAQAAQESGWGNEENKWVANYNNYLGLQIQFNHPKTMPCYKNCRCAGEEKTRCALKFKNTIGCIYEYAMRFNASSLTAYKQFREVRGNLREVNHLHATQQQCENARALVPQLKSYAEEPHYLNFICDRLNDDICEMLKKCPSYKTSSL